MRYQLCLFLDIPENKGTWSITYVQWKGSSQLLRQTPAPHLRGRIHTSPTPPPNIVSSAAALRWLYVTLKNFPVASRLWLGIGG